MKAIVGKRYNFKKDVTFLKTREKQQEEKNNNLKEDIQNIVDIYAIYAIIFYSCVERALTLKCDDQGDATEQVIELGKSSRKLCCLNKPDFTTLATIANSPESC